MNVEFDLENASQAEIETLRAELTRSKSSLADDLQSREIELRRIRELWERLKTETLNRLEHLMFMMSPDSSERSIYKLTLVFPNEDIFAQFLQAKRRESVENPDNAAQMYGNSAGSHREIKAKLRDVLLKSTQMPFTIGEFGSLFRVFLDGKTAFYAQDEILIQFTLQTNQLSAQLNAVREELDFIQSHNIK